MAQIHGNGLQGTIDTQVEFQVWARNAGNVTRDDTTLPLVSQRQIQIYT